MNAVLHVLQGGPSLSVQDLGRTGYRAQGLTIAGAMDTIALHEGAALLGQSAELAAIEMAGSGGVFKATQDIRIALTGAAMAAKVEGTAIAWNASHLLRAGAKLIIGGARSGCYGYLHLGGGVATPLIMGARATHLRAGIGQALQTGDALPIGKDTGHATGLGLALDTRFQGGKLRCVASMQTGSFAADVLERFISTPFRRDARANRMGIRMDHDGAGFTAAGALSIVSEVTVPGDIQLTGDGAPFVLMCECQTTGGYPRIATVIPSDLPRVAQAPAGAQITFEFVEVNVAIDAERRYRAMLKALPRAVSPLVRNPADIAELLGYQLVGGAVSADANPFEQES